MQVGYFKQKQQFYNFKLEEVKDDADFILKKYPHVRLTDLKGGISRKSNQKQREDILKLLGYAPWSERLRPKIESHLCELIKIHPRAHNAFRELLTFLKAQKTILPSYRTLQDIFTKVLRLEQKRMTSIVSSVPNHIQIKLFELIQHEDGLTQLNLMRADQRDFQYTALRLEVEKVKKLSHIYPFCKSFVPKLDISKNAIRYYAELTEQYPPARLKDLVKSKQLLHLICFIYHRYQQFMDNLIVTFIYHVRCILDSARAYAEQEFLQHGSKLIIELPKVAKFLKWFPEQEKNPQVTYEELSQEAYKILPKEQFEPLAEFIEGQSFDKKAAKWNFYKQSSRMFALYLRPILLAIDLEFYKEDGSIMKLIQILKEHYGSNKMPSLLKFKDLNQLLPKNILPYLKANTTDESVDPHLLEFFVYQKIYHYFDRGDIFCNDSVSFGDLDQDLVAEELVDNIEDTCNDLGYSKIPIYCDEHLDHMIGILDIAWDKTLLNIKSGENKGIEIKHKKGKLEWRLLYDSTPETSDALFKDIPQVEISNILRCIGDIIGAWGSINHTKDLYTKRKEPPPTFLNAGILGEAFGLGSKKLSEMSDLNYGMLRSISKDFITVENLSILSKMVGDYIYSLPIFKEWNLVEDKILADADGQKFSTRFQTIQSRYSGKYFGKRKGISIYTLVANFVAVNAKNIGLNEYEGHSLYDIVYGNKTEIPIDMVTGDNHSLNQLNFVALDSINVDYVPSIKNIKKAAEELCSIKFPNHYKGFLKPKRKIDVSLIKSQKKGILRVLLSLLIQENTQSTIIRKLNSHCRYKKLRAALIEYNNVFKSIHVLNLINDMDMRKALKTARNRTESYHQFQSLVRKVYHGEFRGKMIVNNRISAQSSRFVVNCSVAYNATILNELYEKMLRENVPREKIELFLRISPIAWSHISFMGKYNFKKSDGLIDFKQIVAALEEGMKKYFDDQT